MNSWQVIKRLLWKEFREDIFVITIIFVATAVLFYTAANQQNSFIHNAFSFLTAFGVYTLLVIWASVKGDSESHGYQFSMKHLPISPDTSWAVSMGVSALVVISLGAWFGIWASYTAESTKSIYIAAGVLEFLVLYAFCYYFASTFSKWLAIGIGIFHVAASGTLIEAVGLNVHWETDSFAVMIAIAIEAITASYVFVWYANKKTQETRQGISIMVMLIIAIIPVFYALKIGDYFGKKSPAITYELNVIQASEEQPDISIETIYARDAIIYSNHHNGKSRKRVFEQSTKVLGIANQSIVYLIQHLPNDRSAKIIRWDTDTNSERQISSISVLSSLDMIYTFINSFDPTGRYALIQTRALIGDGMDLWLLDLQKGKNSLIQKFATGNRIKQIVWSEKIATIASQEYISWRTDIVLTKINLAKMKAESTKIPLADRSKI